MDEPGIPGTTGTSEGAIDASNIAAALAHAAGLGIKARPTIIPYDAAQGEVRHVALASA
jgi:hypothetical protein